MTPLPDSDSDFSDAVVPLTHVDMALQSVALSAFGEGMQAEQNRVLGVWYNDVFRLVHVAGLKQGHGTPLIEVNEHFNNRDGWHNPPIYKTFKANKVKVDGRRVQDILDEII